jgi:hypothetical protein
MPGRLGLARPHRSLLQRGRTPSAWVWRIMPWRAASGWSCRRASPPSTGLVADACEQIEGCWPWFAAIPCQTLPPPCSAPSGPHRCAVGRPLPARVLARLEVAELDEPALALARETCQSGSPISRAILWRASSAGTAPVPGRGVCRRAGPLGQLRAQRGFRGRVRACSSTRTNHPAGRPAGGRGLAG